MTIPACKVLRQGDRGQPFPGAGGAVWPEAGRPAQNVTHPTRRRASCLSQARGNFQAVEPVALRPVRREVPMATGTMTCFRRRNARGGQGPARLCAGHAEQLSRHRSWPCMAPGTVTCGRGAMAQCPCNEMQWALQWALQWTLRSVGLSHSGRYF